VSGEIYQEWKISIAYNSLGLFGAIFKGELALFDELIYL